MICENCGNDHIGEYGSGRFCSSKCARGYSTKHKRKEINEKVGLALKGRKLDRSTNNWKSDTYEKVRETWNNKLLSSDFTSLGWDGKRKRILLEQNNKCNKCGVREWFEHPISLEVDHINGINTDDRRENLEGLCPNCHSITETWRGRNKPVSNGKIKVSDDELLIALSETKNIRQALLAVGLSAKGNNYKRAKELLGM